MTMTDVRATLLFMFFMFSYSEFEGMMQRETTVFDCIDTMITRDIHKTIKQSIWLA